MKSFQLIKSRLIWLVILLCCMMLTGCGDLVEIQDRDFVLALGISHRNGEYEITYSLPDLGAVTEQAKSADQDSRLRVYKGASLHEIEQTYNFNSEKRLDYRHLQVIILDPSVCSNPQVMKNLLIQINDYYDISHNVLVYYYAGDLRELMGMDGVNSSIGEHLKKLNNNNSVSGLDPAQIGALIDCMENERTLFIPALYSRDNSIAADGGIFFSANHMLRSISQTESDIYYITMGKSNDYLIRLSPDKLIQIKEAKAKTSYELEHQGPVIHLKITGSAKTLPGASSYYHEDLSAAANAYIKDRIETELAEFMKRDRIDYLNLYEKSSYKNRRMWLHYEGRVGDFVEDAEVSVSVDISFES